MSIDPSTEADTLGNQLVELFRRHGITADEHILSACITATTATVRVTVRDEAQRIAGRGPDVFMVERQIALNHRAHT